MDPVPDPAAAPDPPASPRSRAGRARGLVTTILAAVVIALLLKTFVVQVFFIPSVSMQPTLDAGDRILVCRVCTSIGGVDRGDVIVFGDPAPDGGSAGAVGAFVRWLGEGIGVAAPEHEDFVKRVIGLPGDVIELKDGVAYVNGVALEEPYLDLDTDTRPFGPLTVPESMLFVLGDNRIESGDSRFEPPHGVGLVPEDVVIGEAVARMWPPGRWGSV